MKQIFQSYPAHPWLSEWMLEPRDCGTTFRKKNAGYFFKTQEIAGRIAPNLESPEWILQLPIPQNSRFNMLFNGFCGYFNKNKHTCSIEVMMPESGVLWGRFSDIPSPILISDSPIHETAGFQWLENDTTPALLAIRDGQFCLTTKSHIFSDAVQLAESYLAKDLESFLSDELSQRAGANNLLEEMNHHDSLTVISMECMMRALRPAEGDLSGLWSQSPNAEDAEFNANEIYTLTLAWRHINIRVAEDLIRSGLKLQNSSGAIPVTYSPHKTFSILEAPKPLLSKAAEKVWEIRKDPQFLAEIIPLLRRHLQWMLHHFSPKRRGLHCWQSQNESLTQEIYETNLATVDLTVLLLTEIEALNRLQKAEVTSSNYSPYFSNDAETLKHNLQSQFWNEEKGQFNNAILQNRIITLESFSSFIPLLWKKLPHHQKDQILDQVKESGNLPGGVNILSWKKSTLNDHSLPLLQQLILLETLKTADPNGSLIHDFTRITLQGFLEWHTLSIEEQKKLPIDPVAAAYIINLQSTHHYRYHAKKALTRRLFNTVRKYRIDYFDFSVLAVTLLTLFSVHVMYDLMHQPPSLSSLEAKMDSAYSNKDAYQTIRNSTLIITHYPDQAILAKLFMANILMTQKEFEKASALYMDIREKYPDSPGSMIALGLAYQQQGRFEEADKNYTEFIYLFDEILPELVEEIKQYRYLMKEGFRSPPNWQKIYRYQLMHEL